MFLSISHDSLISAIKIYFLIIVLILHIYRVLYNNLIDVYITE